MQQHPGVGLKQAAQSVEHLFAKAVACAACEVHRHPAAAGQLRHHHHRGRPSRSATTAGCDHRAARHRVQAAPPAPKARTSMCS